MPNKEHDNVNHPKHYNSHPSGIEVIEITRHENFNCGNAIKYVMRRKLKGNEIEDLKKARWYLDDEITRLEKEAPPAPKSAVTSDSASLSSKGKTDQNSNHRKRGGKQTRSRSGKASGSGRKV